MSARHAILLMLYKTEKLTFFFGNAICVIGFLLWKYTRFCGFLLWK